MKSQDTINGGWVTCLALMLLYALTLPPYARLLIFISLTVVGAAITSAIMVVRRHRQHKLFYASKRERIEMRLVGISEIQDNRLSLMIRTDNGGFGSLYGGPAIAPPMGGIASRAAAQWVSTNLVNGLHSGYITYNHTDDELVANFLRDTDYYLNDWVALNRIVDQAVSEVAVQEAKTAQLGGQTIEGLQARLEIYYNSPADHETSR